MTKKEKMYHAIAEHGKNLNAIFHTGIDDVKLSKKLFSLENKAHGLSTSYCNGDIDTDQWEKAVEVILARFYKIVGNGNGYNTDIPVHVNGDCRGYALKINDQYTREHNLKIHCDVGGYGIIAPDFRE